MLDYVDNIGSKQSYEIFQHLLNIFSTVTSSKNDFYIVDALLKNLENHQNPSIEELASQANVSTASISRFIKKCGFSSYSEFRNRVLSLTEVAYMNRLGRYTEDKVLNLNGATDNLKSTQQSLDLNKIESIISGFSQGKKRIILGHSDALAQFLPFHKDLFASQISHHFFYDLYTQLFTLEQVNQDTSILYLTLGGITSKPFEKALSDATAKGAKLYMLTQDRQHFLSDAAQSTYVYGIADDMVNGSYSLHFLSGVFSYVLIHKDFSFTEKNSK